MMTDKEIAEFLRIGLSLRFISCEEVERWADTVIERETEPRYPIVKLALAGELHRAEVLELLSEVKGELDVNRPPGMVLALFRKRLVENQLSLDRVMTSIFALYQLPLSGLTTAEQDEINRLDDAWALARDRVHGDAHSVHAELMVFLQDYEQYEKHLPV